LFWSWVIFFSMDVFCWVKLISPAYGWGRPVSKSEIVQRPLSFEGRSNRFDTREAKFKKLKDGRWMARLRFSSMGKPFPLLALISEREGGYQFQTYCPVSGFLFTAMFFLIFIMVLFKLGRLSSLPEQGQMFFIAALLVLATLIGIKFSREKKKIFAVCSRLSQ
jgi:hypothetical protein